LYKDLQKPEMAVETNTVEKIMDINSMERNNAGLFILEYLDILSQNYAKSIFLKKKILLFKGIPLPAFYHKDHRNGSLSFFIRGFDSLNTVY
jgi:hypothetical protein